MKFIKYKLSIVLILLVLSDQSCAQKKSPPVNQHSNLSLANNLNEQRTHLFGIKLRLKALELLREVEDFYGRKVKEVDDTAEDNTSHEAKLGASAAESNVLSDGTPIITIHMKEAKTEYAIVHELYHLKLFTIGLSLTPIIWDGNTKIIEPFVRQFSASVYDPLQHSLFYPKLREMGFDPDEGQREDFKKDLEKVRIVGVKKITSTESKKILIMDYFQHSLHFEDKKLLSEMTEIYKYAGWKEELIKGKEMVFIAKSANLYQPDSMIEAYKKCLNILYKGEAKFTFDRWLQPFPNLPKIQVAVLKIEYIQQK